MYLHKDKELFKDIINAASDRFVVDITEYFIRDQISYETIIQNIKEIIRIGSFN